jgi:large subunit ribosomal protein L30e
MVNKVATKNSETIISNLRLIVKSGRYTLGYKSTLKTLQEGTCKLVILAENCPPTRRLEIEYYAMLNKSLVHHFYGNNTDLGIACGKLFKCSCLGVVDPGDTDLNIMLA